MTMTEFAMVEELASLIKDNLPSKHLVLSVEEILVSLLQENSSSDGILELEPMSPYHRLLLHRLADIFGFAHESVGEGDERHLILQRCSDSSIPSILVSDILLQYDEYQSPTTSTQILKRKDLLPGLNSRDSTFPSSITVEERKAAYLDARERIFSLHNVDDEKEPIASRPRSDPVVARRMIAHALGQKICPSSSLEASHEIWKEHVPTEEPRTAEKLVFHLNSDSEFSKTSKGSSSQELGADERKSNSKGRKSFPVHFSPEIKLESKPVRNNPGNSSSLQTGSNGRVIGIQNLEREHLGAAKRMFAHALGLTSAKSNQC